MRSSGDPHAGAQVLAAGVPLESAHAAMILVHGRGATASSILPLGTELEAPLGAGGFAFLAPQAAGGTWYPESFLASLSRNEPWLGSALDALGRVLERARAAGVPSERTLLAGFSQGACLSLEFAARNARRYGGVAGLSGGLIGPAGTSRDYAGSLEGTPVFLGCDERDPHVPADRVLESAEVLGELGGEVDVRLYPDLGHSVNEEELEAVRGILRGLAGG